MKDDKIIKFRVNVKDDIDLFNERNLAILAQDCIDNFKNINPEYIDEYRLNLISKSNNMIKELRKYVIELLKSYDENDPYNHNASMVILHSVFIEGNVKMLNNEDILDKLIPSYGDDHELYLTLQMHIEDIVKIKSILNKIIEINFDKFISYLCDSKLEFDMLSKNDKIKVFKKSIDKKSKEFITGNAVSYEMDFSKFNGGKVYINRDVYEENKEYILPSKFLLRALKYDMIIVTHGKPMPSAFNNNWFINSISIDNTIYTNIKQLLADHKLLNHKKILLMICNPNDFEIDIREFPKLKNVDITYLHGFNKDSGYEYVFENVIPDLTYRLYDVETAWNRIIKSIKDSIKPVTHIVEEFISDNDPVYYSKNIECIDMHDGINLSLHKCNSQRDFLRIWNNSFSSIIDCYRRIVSVESILLKRYEDIDITLENYYTWGISSKEITPVPIYINTFQYKYNNFYDCLEAALLQAELDTNVSKIAIYKNNNKDHRVVIHLESFCNDMFDNQIKNNNDELFHYVSIDECKRLLSEYSVFTEGSKTIPIYRPEMTVSQYVYTESINIVNDSYYLKEGSLDVFAHKNIITIKLDPKESFMDQYSKIHKVLQEDNKNYNYEGMKNNLALMFSLIRLIERSKKYKNRDKEAVKARAFAINDFKSYLKIVQKYDKNFDFMKFYEENHYGKTIINVDIETIKALKQLFKSILL